MHGQQTQHLSLAEATKIVPGRPSTNCMWRWCRKGVIARSGERIKLQHLRIGGKLFTRADWVDDFGRQLATADARYFDRDDDELLDAPRHQSRCNCEVTSGGVGTSHSLDDIERELDEEGM